MGAGRVPRQRDFFFTPTDYLRDVKGMSLAARGAYSTLLLELWDQDEPGVCPDDDSILAGLAWATPEEWARLRPEVIRRFDLHLRPGFWVQKRMVIEHRRQDEYHEKKSRGGKKGREKQLAGIARGKSGLSPGAFQPLGFSATPTTVPLTSLSAERAAKVRTVRTRTGRTPTPEAQAQIDALRDAGLLPAEPRADETAFDGGLTDE